MAERLLLLEVAGRPGALGRLRSRLPDTVWRSREIVVPLDHHTAEEVLALCCALGVQVRRSRVMRQPCGLLSVVGQPTADS